MKNTFGSSISITLFGESHGETNGAVLDGLAPGIEINDEYIKSRLALRRPGGAISTARVEPDEYSIVSGVFNGYTTGAPLCILIPNTNKRSTDYAALADTPRPSHADLAASYKYHGYEDKRGGGHFSGRLTAPIVAAGAIVEYALAKKGIRIGTHISSMRGITDRAFECYESDIEALALKAFPTLSDECGEAMKAQITEAAKNGDSVGGILESVIIGMPCGVGEPWFDTLEGKLAQAMLSIPAVKGVEFGLGFGFGSALGSEVNDEYITDGKSITTKTNNNGGINGGISNGAPILMRLAVKPTPSISREQASVSLSKMENVTLNIGGRHDPAIIHRARVVADAMAAITIADMLALRFGTDFLA